MKLPICAHRQTRLTGGVVPFGCYTKYTTCGARFFNKIEPIQRGQRRS